jgi:serine protease Do
VDGFAIRNENHLINMISGIPAGQKVKLQVWRERKAVLVEAVVGDWSKNQGRFKAAP